MKSVTLYFTRQFTSGTLNGLTHQDKITYPSMSECIDWANQINKKNAKGKLDYKIVDKSFQCYFR